MAESDDAIVIGARCGGAPTAMLLARKGYRVLLVDRATFPSDTVSTHFIHAPGMAALQRWGLRGAVGGDGLSRDPDLQLRPRTVHDHGVAPGGRRRRRGLLPAPARARHDAGPRSSRRRCRRARGLHRRRHPHRGRNRHRCARQGGGRRHGDRTRQGRDRRRRPQLLGRQGSRARAVQRQAGRDAAGSRFVRLENLDTSNGPDLFVYLSTNPPDGPEGRFDDDYVNLGRLQGNVGSSNYLIPGAPTCPATAVS